MKSVLCYGDSNTWGAATIARESARYRHDERWPGVLRAALGEGWLVIEEGLGGRTTVNDDPVEGIEKNGLTYLYPCLMSHKPLDWVVIMLGTNDLKARFNKTPWEVAAGVGRLVDMVKSAPIGHDSAKPEILVICPPPFEPLTGYAEMFAGAEPKSRELAKYFRKVADVAHVRFLDAGTVIRSSRVDGFHLDPDAHALLGKAVAEVIAS